MTTFEKELTAALLDILPAAVNRAGSNDADDLVQDVAEHAWKYRDRYKVGTNMAAWLMTIMRWTIARRHQFNGYKKRTAIIMPLIENDEIDVPEPGDQDMRFASPKFFETYPEEYLSTETHSAMNAISPRHKYLLIMCDMQDTPRDEVRCILGYDTTRQLSKHLCRARTKLRAQLEAV